MSAAQLERAVKDADAGLRLLFPGHEVKRSRYWGRVAGDRYLSVSFLSDSAGRNRAGAVALLLRQVVDLAPTHFYHLPQPHKGRSVGAIRAEYSIAEDLVRLWCHMHKVPSPSSTRRRKK